MLTNKEEKERLEAENRLLYIVDEYDPLPVQRQHQRRLQVDDDDDDEETEDNKADPKKLFSFGKDGKKKKKKDVMDGPPFCMFTASHALYLSTLTYLEANARGLSEEKYEDLHNQLEHVSCERGLVVVDRKEFYHKEGMETIRCLCFALKKKSLMEPGRGCEEGEEEQEQEETEGGEVVYENGSQAEMYFDAEKGEGSDEDDEKYDAQQKIEHNLYGKNVRRVQSRHNRILIAFRGTDTVQNVIADVKTWTVSHPPERGSVISGTRPMVHKGFLTAWRNDDLRQQVLDFVMEHTKDMRGAELDHMNKTGLEYTPWPTVTVTGHSLGGSVATLASYDIATQLKSFSDSLIHNNSFFMGAKDSILSKPAHMSFPRGDLRLYTYGCPRVGNVPFADSVNELVPNAWNIINENDIVPAVPAKQSSRLVGPPFQRVGRQVFIQEDGTFYINPSRKMRRMRQLKVLKLGSSAAAHETGNYRKGLLNVFKKEGLLSLGGDDEDGGKVDGSAARRLRAGSMKSKETLRLSAESLEVLGNIITEARNMNRSFRVLPGAT